MGICFQNWLKENTNIPESRIPALDKGIDELHRGLAYMTENSLEAVKEAGNIAGLLYQFSLVEELSKLPSKVLHPLQRLYGNGSAVQRS